MRKIFITVIFISSMFTNNLLGQKNNSHIRLKNLILLQENKVSTSILYQSSQIAVHDSISSIEILFFNPSIEFISAKGNSHELIINNLSIKENNIDLVKEIDSSNINEMVSRYIETSLDLKLSYNFNYRINKSKSVFEYYFGIGITPYINVVKTKPESNITPPVQTIIFKHLGFNITLKPRAVYQLSKNIFIGIQIPMPLYQFNKNTTVIKGESENFNSSSNAFFPENISIGLSLGIKI